MLQINPEQRSSAEQLLKDAWFTKQENIEDYKCVKKVLKGLRNFHTHNYLESLIFFYTTSSMMSQEEKREIYNVFSELDEDNDGKLSKEELIRGFEKSGRTRERSESLVEKILKELNLNEKEGINYD